MNHDYFQFKKQFKLQNNNLWTKQEFWLKLDEAWSQIKDLPIQQKEKSKPAKDYPFKQFFVKQQDNVFKVGTDGVLLGAWTLCHQAQRILEIGTGTGYITLMLAQRNQNGIFHAIDIMDTAVQLAKQNFENSKWKERLSLTHSSLQDFKPNNVFDLIVCAPPYFQNSTLKGFKEIDVARHQITLTLDEIIKFAQQYLSQNGQISMIIPFQQKDELLQSCQNRNLYLQREVIIKGTPIKNPKRLLVQIGKEQKILQTENLIIETNGRHFYSPEFIELTKEYYQYFIPESLKQI